MEVSAQSATPPAEPRPSPRRPCRRSAHDTELRSATFTSKKPRSGKSFGRGSRSLGSRRRLSGRSAARALSHQCIELRDGALQPCGESICAKPGFMAPSMMRAAAMWETALSSARENPMSVSLSFLATTMSGRLSGVAPANPGAGHAVCIACDVFRRCGGHHHYHDPGAACSFYGLALRLPRGLSIRCKRPSKVHHVAGDVRHGPWMDRAAPPRPRPYARSLPK